MCPSCHGLHGHHGCLPKVNVCAQGLRQGGGSAAGTPAAGVPAQATLQTLGLGGCPGHLLLPWDVFTWLCCSRTACGGHRPVTASGGRNAGVEAAPGCTAEVCPGPRGGGGGGASPAPAAGAASSAHWQDRDAGWGWRGDTHGTVPGNPRGPQESPEALPPRWGLGSPLRRTPLRPAGGCTGPPEPRAPPSLSPEGRCAPAAPAAPSAPSPPVGSRCPGAGRGGEEGGGDRRRGQAPAPPQLPGAAAGDAGPRRQRRGVRSAERPGPAAPGGAGRGALGCAPPPPPPPVPAGGAGRRDAAPRPRSLPPRRSLPPSRHSRRRRGSGKSFRRSGRARRSRSRSRSPPAPRCAREPPRAQPRQVRGRGGAGGRAAPIPAVSGLPVRRDAARPVAWMRTRVAAAHPRGCGRSPGSAERQLPEPSRCWAPVAVGLSPSARRVLGRGGPGWAAPAPRLSRCLRRP